jgi:hypothetical protein
MGSENLHTLMEFILKETLRMIESAEKALFTIKKIDQHIQGTGKMTNFMGKEYFTISTLSPWKPLSIIKILVKSQIFGSNMKVIWYVYRRVFL